MLSEKIEEWNSGTLEYWVRTIHGEAGFDAIAITDHLSDTQSPGSLQLCDEGEWIKGFTQRAFIPLRHSWAYFQ